VQFFAQTSMQCGRLGAACASCTNGSCDSNGYCACDPQHPCGPGQICKGIQCQCAPLLCDGCCEGDMCIALDAQSTSQCGAHATCQACVAGQACVDGGCG
jgi:hypothetical protein